MTEPISTTVTVHGLQELDAKFAEIDVVTGQKTLRGALMFAATPIHKAMREGAPVGVDPDYLERKAQQKNPPSLRKGTRKWSEKANENASATVNVGYRMKRHWYAGLLEFGTKHIAPVGWMRRAADQNWNESVIRFKKNLAKRFERLGI